MTDGKGKIVGWIEFLSESGVQCADVDGATNLEQEIGAAPEPAHLLRFIHSTVHQEIGGPSVMAVPTSNDEVRALLERTHCLH